MTCCCNGSELSSSTEKQKTKQDYHYNSQYHGATSVLIGMKQIKQDFCCESHGPMCLFLPPKGFWRSGENGYIFSGSWGALAIIFKDLGIKLKFFGI